MKKVKDEYFVWHLVKGWVEVKGEPVVIHGFEEYDLFVHEEVVLHRHGLLDRAREGLVRVLFDA